MNVAAFLALLAVTLAWVLLPLLPALRELLQPTDATPLNAVGQDAGDLAVFAAGFRDYLARATPAEGGRSPDGTASGAGTLNDGTPFVRLGGDTAPLRAVARPDGAIPCIVLADEAVALDGGETFLLEVHARGAWTGGDDAAYRALLGDQDVSLGARSEVLRWVHAAGDLHLGAGSILHGRASANGRMQLAQGATFRRIRAAAIVAGTGERELPDPVAPPPVLAGTVRFPSRTRRDRGYTRVEGDFTIPASGAVAGALVVTGRLTIERGARLGGSVKCHGACHIGEEVVIDGTVVARGDVVVGERAWVRGSVVSERDVQLAAGATVGAPATPASLTGRRLALASGARVYGAASGREAARID